jgi:hypothetical protein
MMAGSFGGRRARFVVTSGGGRGREVDGAVNQDKYAISISDSSIFLNRYNREY